jgi:hypothetical protein
MEFHINTMERQSMRNLSNIDFQKATQSLQVSHKVDTNIINIISIPQ